MKTKSPKLEKDISTLLGGEPRDHYRWMKLGNIWSITKFFRSKDIRDDYETNFTLYTEYCYRANSDTSIGTVLDNLEEDFKSGIDEVRKLRKKLEGKMKTKGTK
jgi:hypothetical protein